MMEKLDFLMLIRFMEVKRFQDTKIGCIPGRNQWNKLIFGVLIKIQERQKLF